MRSGAWRLDDASGSIRFEGDKPLFLSKASSCIRHQILYGLVEVPGIDIRTGKILGAPLRLLTILFGAWWL